MTFVSERMVKAVRREHVCDGCQRKIERGQPALRWAGHADGDFSTAIYHPDCREAEVALNDLCGWRWGDDWWPLHEADHGERDWLREKFPAVIARMETNSGASQ